jgi:signal transduction histidine kinase
MHVLAWLSSLLCVVALVVMEDLFGDPAAPILKEMREIDDELASLAPARLTPAVPTLGYLSGYWKCPDVSFPVDIVLHRVARLDTLMILPVAAVDEQNVSRSFQFPLRFTIELIAADGTSRMIADYSQEDYPTPGLEPQIFPCPPEFEVQSIRLTTLRLRKNPQEASKDFFMTLGEVLAFSGQWNAALNAEVRTESSKPVPLTWHPSFLVDGFTNYAPVELDIDRPIIRMSIRADQLTVTLDMGKQVVADELRVWPIDYSSNHSHTGSHGRGFPLNLQLEAALQPDFSDAQVIYSDDHFPRPNVGPLMRAVTPVKGRYLRLTARNGYKHPGDSETGIGFAELELFQQGKLLSQGITPELTGWSGRNFSSQLTDGFSKTGRIHPLKNWMLQVARRAALEKRHADLSLALDSVHARQSATLRWAGTFLAALIGVFLLLFFILRYRHEKRLHQMRDDIAGDLHDEVGANISSIAGTAEILLETLPDATPKQNKLFGDIIRTARRTARETNRLIQFLERRRMDGDLVLQMESTARQLLPDTEHQCHWHDTEVFNRLPSTKKWDLLFFFKESLHNIVKHSHATLVTVNGSASGGMLTLSVHDNGTGISDKAKTPAHLKLRARKLQGRLSVQSSADTGTTICLNMKIPRSSHAPSPHD